MEQLSEEQRLVKIHEALEADSATSGDECDDLIEVVAKPVYFPSPHYRLVLSFELRCKAPDRVLETFGATINFLKDGGRREARCTGHLYIPEYRGDLWILPVRLSRGTHQGAFVVGAFIATEAGYSLCTKSGTFEFRVD